MFRVPSFPQYLCPKKRKLTYICHNVVFILQLLYELELYNKKVDKILQCKCV